MGEGPLFYQKVSRLSRTPKPRRAAVTVAAALFVLYPACLPAAVASTYDAFGLVRSGPRSLPAAGTPPQILPRTSPGLPLRPSQSLPSGDAVASLDSILSDSRTRLAKLVLGAQTRPDLDLSAALAAARSQVAELESRLSALRSALSGAGSARSALVAPTTALSGARTAQSAAAARLLVAEDDLSRATAALGSASALESSARSTLAGLTARVASARSALDVAAAARSIAQTAVSDAESLFNARYAEYADVLARLSVAAAARDVAQVAYDTNLVPDPTWTPLTYEQERTRTVEVVSVVPRTVTTLTGGLTADVFSRQGYNNAPPIPTASEVPFYSTVVPSIDFQWGGGQVLNSGRSEDVIVRFTGSISLPTTGYYQFYSPADDGTMLYLDGVRVISDWRDKGGGGSTSAPVYFEAGVAKTLTLYYYENGGGANVWLYYYTPATGYVLVPAACLGTVASTETVYDHVTTHVEETYYTTEVYPDQVHPLIKDPALLPEVERTREAHDAVMSTYNDYANSVNEAGWAWQDRSSELVAAAVQESSARDSLTAVTALETGAQTALNEATSALAASTAARDASVVLRDSEASTASQAITQVSTAESQLASAVAALTSAEELAESAFASASALVPDLSSIEEQLATDPPKPEPEPVPAPGSPDLPTDLSADNLMEVDLAQVDPTELTDAQAEQLVVAALETFETATEGSPEYEQALDALFLAAQQDDLVVDEALASIPGVGQAAAAVVAIFNIVGNVGADISPKARKKAQSLVVTTLIVGQIAQAAALASASSGGSYRRK